VPDIDMRTEQVGNQTRGVLHLNLAVEATRAAIRESLSGHLPAETLSDIDARVRAAGIDEAHYHDLGAIEEALDGARISARVRADARAIYRILAQGEAQVHGCTIDEAHFHEVGDGQTLREVLAVCMIIEAIDPVEIVATPVQVGSGQVTCAHGVLDIPAPATAAILSDDIPRCPELRDGELCTPTSAALIRYYVDRFEEGAV